jgi:hypothetical protein
MRARGSPSPASGSRQRPFESAIEVNDIDVVLQRAAVDQLLHRDDAEGVDVLSSALNSSHIDM